MKAVLVSTAAFAIQANAVSVYGQCGGKNWNGSGTCDAGSVCTYQNDYYSQCLPVSSNVSPTSSKSVSSSTTSKPRTTFKTKTTAVSTTHHPTSSSTSQPGKLKYGGINIAGFDFGCSIDGTCTVQGAYPPLLPNGNDGLGQMKHFVKDDGFNAFRLPTSWQYLVNDQLGNPLNAANLATYDKLVQGCVDAGAAFCEIDIHNYARYNGAIIGQGGPTNAQFAAFWGALAGRYASNSKVAFGLMNEPHNLDISTWAATVQAAVTAIRKAGANNLILLPGTSFASAGDFISSGSAAALNAVTNPDGTKTGLIFDVHRYLDSDNSGSSAECVTNNIDNTFAPLATWLRSNGRQAMLTETGGGNVASCIQYLSQELKYLAQNSDVYLGFTTWAAGSFDTAYTLSETPTQNSDGTWKDQSLVSQAIASAFRGS
ncbi:Hypothetical protein R9X50_00725900 [Acrodontium crateriforme]|uniref:Endoglucanase EG-II n=1 Tax=Acrodontium crateriforme TaxID=150365 RepID=A0AAQ3M9V9_9PEZI|nr:Hypothetical protein R9X50_00725900 [Acrodontium crateriforme]